jgi:O-antigen ligase/polysaccharide polymerase Wzy-like membrane protein
MAAPLSAAGRSRLAVAAPFLPAAALLAVWVLWIPRDGGYFPRAWYPAGIFVVGLLAAVALASSRWRPPPRAGRVALALLGAFTAWSFLSLLWADSPGSGWAASDQLLLYLAVAWLVALVPWRADSAAAFMGLWALAVAVVCLVELVSALDATGLGHYIFESRWQQPTGYANAAAALPAMACWPALMLASRRDVPAPLQVLFLVAATFLVEFSLLPQSRGWAIGILVAIPVFVALAPDRPRLLLRLAILGGGLAVAGGPVWDLYGAGEAKRSLGAALDSAAESILLSIALVAVAGCIAAVVEREIRPGETVTRAARRFALALVVVLALGVGGLAVAHAGDAADYASERWRDFSSNREVADTNPNRLAQKSSDKRYDYWRVSVETFRAAPVGGVGAGGFERVYSKERRHAKPSRSAHSLWMRSLAELGAVGTILLLALAVALVVGLVRARSRLDHRGRGIVAAAAGAGAYFVGHASVDWLELFPALAAPAVALPFVALRVDVPDSAPGSERTPRRRRLGWLAGAGGALLAAVAIASLALPYLAVRYVDGARRSARAHPVAAARDLRRAAALNPLSPDPRYVQGRIALDHRRYADARTAFERALDREDAWYPHFELALLDAREGHFAGARREIARAHALNPPDPLVAKAMGLIARRKRVDPAGVDRNKLVIPLYKDPRHL